jgi:pyrroloquinoline quinone (PQQ) biosynthesis protein C
MGYPDENMSHYLLAVDMLRAIGLTDTQIVSIQMLPDSQSYIEGHLNYTRDQALARGIGCLGIGIEELTKMEFNRLGNAFIKSSQLTGVLTPEDAYREQGYFVANIMADEQHSTEFAEIGFLAHKAGEIPRDLTTCFAQIHEGARYSLDLRQKFFDGVYRKATKTQH